MIQINIGWFAFISFYFISILLFYAYFAHSLNLIAGKLKNQNRVWAWIPLANIFLIFQLAGKPWWWFFLFMIPVLNVVLAIIIWMEIAKNLGKPDWMGVLTIVPFANLFLPAYLAGSPRNKTEKTALGPYLLLGFSFLSLLATLAAGILVAISNPDIKNAFLRNQKAIPAGQTYTAAEITPFKPSAAVPTLASLEGSQEKAIRLEEWKNESVGYWNCAYWYSLRYPVNWTNNGMTYQSDKAEMKGDGAILTVEAFANTSDTTLDDFAQVRKMGITGKETGSRDRMRNGVRIIAYEFEDPYEVVVFWQRQGDFMEFSLKIPSKSLSENTVSNIISTFNTNPNDLPECSSQNRSPDNQSQYNSNPAADEASCSHPNGDVEYWWEDATKAQQDCYISQYGYPQYLNQQTDVPYCDYENNPDCWPPGEFPGSSGIDSFDHPNGDIENW